MSFMDAKDKCSARIVRQLMVTLGVPPGLKFNWSVRKQLEQMTRLELDALTEEITKGEKTT